jgi:hypothetical protein
MVGEICATIKNYFCKEKYFGTFEVRDGSLYVLSSAGLAAGLDVDNQFVPGQYIRVVGSVLNDGVYMIGSADYTGSEIFNGSIWSLALPKDFLDLATEIQDWCEANKNTLESPYTSESFGGYSYTKKAGSNSDGGAYTWQDQFASRLNRWRKARV